jgi:two-component system cell cycle response regulator DivK
MYHILIIEDNELNAELVARLLAMEGYTGDVVANGAMGLVAAWTKHPDLIVMDMSMPVFDGWAATRQLKGARETQAIPILALTAHAMSGDRARCLAAGWDDYDTKPVNSARLPNKIATLLANRGGHGPSTAARRPGAA